jgi:hypothetical protein
MVPCTKSKLIINFLDRLRRLILLCREVVLQALPTEKA